MRHIRTRTTLAAILLSVGLLSMAACSGSTSAGGSAPSTAPTAATAATSATAAAIAATAATAPTVGSSTAVAAGNSGPGITVDCSALTKAQLTAALGGTVSVGQKVSPPTGPECDWTVSGSKLQVGDQDPTEFSLMAYSFASKDSWIEHATSGQYTPLPPIGGDSAYWYPDSPVNITDTIEIWDGTKDVDLDLVVVPDPTTAAGRTAIESALTMLGTDLTTH